MPQVIEIPGKGRVEFPDGMSDAQIVAAIKKLTTNSTPKEPESPTSIKNLIGAALEPNAALLSGAVAMPIAGLAGLASGVGNALNIPGLKGMEPDKVVEKVGSALTYEPLTTGGKNALWALMKPMELLSDAAYEAGGKVTDWTGDPAKGAAANTIINMLPSVVGAGFAKPGTPSTIKRVGDAMSSKMMKSALKPSAEAAKSGAADVAVKTLLDEGINVTPGGRGKLLDRVVETNDKITNAIANSPERVGKADVASRLYDTMDRVEKQVTPNADVRAVQNVWDEFLQHPLVPGKDMPVPLAQQMKTNTYKILKDKYGQLGSAETEAQKALARGLKEEIAKKVPEVGPLNAEESALIKTLDLVTHRTAVDANKNPIGLGFLGSSVPRTAAFMADRSALVKSLIARALNPGDALGINDSAALYSMIPQSFSDDYKTRQKVIDALIGNKEGGSP